MNQISKMMATTKDTVLGALGLAQRANVPPQMKADFAERTRVSVHIIKIYAIVLCCPMVLCFAWYFYASRVRKERQPRPSWTKPLVSAWRTIKGLGVHSVPGFFSAGEGAIVATFVGLNILFSFVKVTGKYVTDYGARFGWMAVINLVFTLFLSVKNTPLSPLTGYSHDRLNRLHQFAGYASVLHTFLHGLIYIAYFCETGKGAILVNRFQIAGTVAGLAMLLIVATAIGLRRRYYELFYVLHVGLFVVGAATTMAHQPENVLAPVAVALAFWGIDRVLRLAKLAGYAVNNDVSLVVLDGGGVRMKLKKQPVGTVPGSHCFVWVPQMRAFETHPFTILDSHRMEIVLKAHSGFTGALHSYAAPYADNDGGGWAPALRASVDGPYGRFPDTRSYDRMVTIAGGTGAAFCFALAQDYLDDEGRGAGATEKSSRRLDFVWVVNSYDKFSWFSAQLGTLRTYSAPPSVHVYLYVSQPDAPPKLEGPVLSASQTNTSVAPSSSAPLSSSSSLAIKHSDQPTVSQTIPHERGRPDVEKYIEKAADTEPPEKILVTVCGPEGLTRAVRNAVSRTIRRRGADGPSVDIHCEEFGW